MKKVLCLCWFLSCFAFAANAGVSFLPAGSSSVGVSKKTQTITSDQKCKNENYRKTCSGKQIGVDPCPHNNKYYKSCCNAAYNFTKEECIKNGLRYSTQTCGGKHYCM